MAAPLTGLFANHGGTIIRAKERVKVILSHPSTQETRPLRPDRNRTRQEVFAAFPKVLCYDAATMPEETKPATRTRGQPVKHKNTNRGKTVPGQDAKEIFAEAYVNDRGKGRTRRAAQKAYPNQSKNSAYVTGSRLLRDTKVQAAIRSRLERAEKQSDISRKAVEGLLAEQVFSSYTDVLKDGDLDWAEAIKRGKDHLIRSITVTERHSKDGAYRRSTTYQLVDNQKAAALLADMKGWKREAAKNPADVAADTFRAMRQNPDYAELADEELAKYPAERYGVTVQDILISATK